MLHLKKILTITGFKIVSRCHSVFLSCHPVSSEFKARGDDLIDWCRNIHHRMWRHPSLPIRRGSLSRCGEKRQCSELFANVPNYRPIDWPTSAQSPSRWGQSERMWPGKKYRNRHSLVPIEGINQVSGYQSAWDQMRLQQSNGRQINAADWGTPQGRGPLIWKHMKAAGLVCSWIILTESTSVAPVEHLAVTDPDIRSVKGAFLYKCFFFVNKKTNFYLLLF